MAVEFCIGTGWKVLAPTVCFVPLKIQWLSENTIHNIWMLDILADAATCFKDPRYTHIKWAEYSN